MKTILIHLAQSVQGLGTGFLALALLALSIPDTSQVSKGSEFASAGHPTPPSRVVRFHDDVFLDLTEYSHF